ncbi:MAG: hypothetical protein WCA92_08965 [Terriglobales bacterium]
MSAAQLDFVKHEVPQIGRHAVILAPMKTEKYIKCNLQNIVISLGTAVRSNNMEDSELQDLVVLVRQPTAIKNV